MSELMNRVLQVRHRACKVAGMPPDTLYLDPHTWLKLRAEVGDSGTILFHGSAPPQLAGMEVFVVSTEREHLQVGYKV